MNKLTEIGLFILCCSVSISLLAYVAFSFWLYV